MARGNKPPEQIVESIFSAMEQIRAPVTLHAISQYATVDYKTARRWVPLIVLIQNKPKVHKSPDGILYGLSKIAKKKATSKKE